MRFLDFLCSGLGNRGFSIISAIVGMSIALVAATTIMQLMLGQQKLAKNVDLAIEITNLNSEIRNLLVNDQACTSSFVGLKPRDTVEYPTELRRPDNSVAYQVGANFINNQVQLDSMKLSGFIAVDAASPTIGISQLLLTYKKNNNVLGGSYVVKVINLRTEIDGGDASILSCNSSASPGGAVWSRTTNQLDIYFDTGKVGVGTNNPTSILDVVGDIKATELSMFNQGVRLGLNPTTCDSTIDGALSYDSSSKVIYICNGTDWLPLASSWVETPCSSGCTGGDAAFRSLNYPGKPGICAETANAMVNFWYPDITTATYLCRKEGYDIGRVGAVGNASGWVWDNLIIVRARSTNGNNADDFEIICSNCVPPGNGGPCQAGARVHIASVFCQ